MGLKEIFKEGKARKQVLKMDDLTIDSKVFIQGTEFDRKRTLTDKQLKKIKFDLAEGMSVKEVASKYEVSEWVIRYNTNEDFRNHQLALRKGKSKTHVNFFDQENRVNYKRYLVKKRKIKVAGIV